MICWTVIENWLDNRDVLDASVGYGLLLVLAGGVALGGRRGPARDRARAPGPRLNAHVDCSARESGDARRRATSPRLAGRTTVETISP